MLRFGKFVVVQMNSTLWPLAAVAGKDTPSHGLAAGSSRSMRIWGTLQRKDKSQNSSWCAFLVTMRTYSSCLDAAGLGAPDLVQVSKPPDGKHLLY